MDLFNADISNLLPCDGTVLYYGKILSTNEATEFYNTLMHTIAWKNDEAKIFGKHYITKRKAAWYGDKKYSYTYSNATKTALPWTKELMDLKALCEKITGATYNSCLLNLYHDGSEGMAWHSDDEKALKEDASVASLSFGAERKFVFKHKNKEQTVGLVLEHGSLLEMTGLTQKYWWHRLPPTTKIKSPRINLTFRTMVEN